MDFEQHLPSIKAAILLVCAVLNPVPHRVCLRLGGWLCMWQQGQTSCLWLGRRTWQCPSSRGWREREPRPALERRWVVPWVFPLSGSLLSPWQYLLLWFQNSPSLVPTFLSHWTKNRGHLFLWSPLPFLGNFPWGTDGHIANCCLIWVDFGSVNAHIKVNAVLWFCHDIGIAFSCLQLSFRRDLGNKLGFSVEFSVFKLVHLILNCSTCNVILKPWIKH